MYPAVQYRQNFFSKSFLVTVLWIHGLGICEHETDYAFFFLNLLYQMLVRPVTICVVLKKTRKQIMDFLFWKNHYSMTQIRPRPALQVSQVLAAQGAYVKQLGQSFLCNVKTSTANPVPPSTPCCSRTSQHPLLFSFFRSNCSLFRSAVLLEA